ncbi:Maltose O-acetyltransferase [Poriferisphaera corsica]|uniref:Maltose O-acetyltransferase n=1 Tax=Poriferisphaera corsica TaxID=2528020 RepID=A0A517YPY9_9BACT|nr:putative colanic acid biosynthesis acetyltransferase [Poriferisphaera corsica]QDU32294.1 Maltose O-acetyltransferase [Poriferisphaera corsica]
MAKKIFQQLDQCEGFPYTRKEYLMRALWGVVYWIGFRWSPVRCYGYRRFLLRLFGCEITGRAGVRRSVRITHPWKLKVGDWSMIGDGVTVYNLGEVRIGEHTVVSQHVHLCAGTHNYRERNLPLMRSEIVIGDGVWLCADAFVGPGVEVGDNAVVGARAVVVKDVGDGDVVGGNPAKVVGRRCEEEGGR